MKPEKILSEYLEDVQLQRKIAIENNCLEDAKKMDAIIEDFRSSINLLQFFRRQYKDLKVIRKKYAV